MDQIDNIGSRIIVDWNFQTYKAASPEHIDQESLARTLDPMIPELYSTLWYAIKNLLSRPWFERLWIWQEVTLARKKISVLCGHSEVPYNYFCNAVHILFLERYSLRMEVLAPVHDFLQFSSRKSKDSMRILIEATQDCKCSDQRDKIFGILNLTDDQIDIIADYSKPVREVFQDFVTHLLVKIRRLNILAFCSLKTSPLVLPTWANWSVPPTSVRIPLQQADAVTDARAFPAGSGVLVATGICVAKVEQIEHTGDFQRAVSIRTAEGWEIARDLGNLATAIVGVGNSSFVEAKVESVCRAICCDDFSYKYPDPDQEEYYPDFRNSIEYTSQCWAWSKEGCSSEDPTVVSPHIWQFVRAAASILAGRSVIKTSNGLIGITPEDTQKGDVVCILLGCRSPLILRPKEAGQYAIVGECYIDGIMTGETFLGQLPGNWRIVRKFFPQYGGFWNSFLESQYGICQSEDPRLGPLPDGWRYKHRYDQDADPEYMNDETGEDLGYLHPNLRYEVLKARGLEFQDFRLV